MLDRLRPSLRVRGWLVRVGVLFLVPAVLIGANPQAASAAATESWRFNVDVPWDVDVKCSVGAAQSGTSVAVGAGWCDGPSDISPGWCEFPEAACTSLSLVMKGIGPAGACSVTIPTSAPTPREGDGIRSVQFDWAGGAVDVGTCAPTEVCLTLHNGDGWGKGNTGVGCVPTSFGASPVTEFCEYGTPVGAGIPTHEHVQAKYWRMTQPPPYATRTRHRSHAHSP